MKKILALLMSIIMIVGLVGCGQKAVTEDEYIKKIAELSIEELNSFQDFSETLLGIYLRNEGEVHDLISKVENNKAVLFEFQAIIPPTEYEKKHKMFVSNLEDKIKYEEELMKAMNDGCEDSEWWELVEQREVYRRLATTYEDEIVAKLENMNSELKHQAVEEYLSE